MKKKDLCPYVHPGQVLVSLCLKSVDSSAFKTKGHKPLTRTQAMKKKSYVLMSTRVKCLCPYVKKRS